MTTIYQALFKPRRTLALQRPALLQQALGPVLLGAALTMGAWAQAQTPAAVPAPLAPMAPAAYSQLTPQAERITDTAIQADHAAYKTLQGRIHALNEGGRPVRDYHLSKAQCWLDVSLHEYTRNDRSAFVQEAMTESEKLIYAMANRVSPISTDTPLVNDAARLRPDLWEKTAGLKQHAGFQCAQQKVACAEVELVHAGNEFNQQQWRHAKPYVQIAEDLLVQAQSMAEACFPVVVAAPAPAAVTLNARVRLDFDRFEAQNADLSELNQLIAQIKSQGLQVKSISLVGHADRLNSTGSAAYNQQLSQKRSATVRQVIGQSGLAVDNVSVQARGDSEQVEACSALPKASDALKACLKANRRVQVQVVAVPMAR